jgi:multiple sugar transport system substrate-binding protein
MIRSPFFAPLPWRGLRSLARLTLLLLTALALSACPAMPQAGQPPASGAVAPEKPLAGQRITVVMSQGSTVTPAQTAAYTELTGLEFDLIELPYGQLYEKQLLNLSQGTAAYDVVYLDDPWWPQFASGGWLTPFQPFFDARGITGPDDDLIERPLLLSRWPSSPDGELFGITAVGNVQLFVYRTDLAEEYDLLPLDTWDQVERAAEIIEANEPGMKGYVMRGQKDNPATSASLPVFWGFGCRLFSDDWRPQTDSEQCLAAFEFYDELARLHSPPGIATYNSTEVQRALQQGEAAMAMVWPSWAANLDNPEESNTVGLWNWTTAPVQPGEEGGPMMGVWMMAIPQGSENKDLAFDYILWATGPEGQKIQAMLGSPPTRVSVFQDPEVLEVYPHFSAVMESLEVARMRPRTPFWGRAETVWGTHISAMLAGITPPEEASRLITQELTDIMVSEGIIEPE